MAGKKRAKGPAIPPSRPKTARDWPFRLISNAKSPGKTRKLFCGALDGIRIFYNHSTGMVRGDYRLFVRSRTFFGPCGEEFLDDLEFFWISDGVGFRFQLPDL